MSPRSKHSGTLDTLVKYSWEYSIVVNFLKGSDKTADLPDKRRGKSKTLLKVVLQTCHPLLPIKAPHAAVKYSPQTNI